MNDADWLRKRLRNKDRSTGCLLWLGAVVLLLGLI